MTTSFLEKLFEPLWLIQHHCKLCQILCKLFDLKKLQNNLKWNAKKKVFFTFLILCELPQGGWVRGQSRPGQEENLTGSHLIHLQEGILVRWELLQKISQNKWQSRCAMYNVHNHKSRKQFVGSSFQRPILGPKNGEKVPKCGTQICLSKVGYSWKSEESFNNMPDAIFFRRV